MKGSGHDLFALLREFFTVILSGHLPSKPLFLALLSKGLGLSIVVGASMVKLPQILAVRNSKSAEGLSRIAYELEEIGLAVMSANGFVMGLPFSAFGEAVFLLIQNTFLLGQIYYYSKTPASRGLAWATALAAWFAAVALGHVDRNIMVRLLDMVTLIFLSSRLPQIYQNFKNKGTGQLSIITTTANFGGALVRIFTTLQEGGSAAMVRGYMLGAAMSATLLSQILYYRRRAAGPKIKVKIKIKGKR